MSTRWERELSVPPTDPITARPPTPGGRLRRRAISAVVAALATAGAAGAVAATAHAARYTPNHHPGSAANPDRTAR